MDDDGKAVRPQRKLPRISWRKILLDEGSRGMWRGWGCRLLHETLWRSLAVTSWEVLLYAPGNGRTGLVAKLVLAMGASALLVHPLHVLETRVSAG